MHLINPLLITGLLAVNVAAHPGHHIQSEIAERAAFVQTSRRELSHCAAKMKARGLDMANIARRSALAAQGREERNLATEAKYLKLSGRDAVSVLNTTHLSPTDYTNATDEAIIFAGNNSCILSPKVTEGPYYVSGEYVRADVTESQAGVQLILDTQVIDMATCDPVPAAMIEIWHCNSTGLMRATSTILSCAGVAQFNTLFPGHYTGRTTHIHILAHFNGTTFPNWTYGGGTVSHVGQVFFDQDLVSAVEATSVYNTNTQNLTTNAKDSIFAQEAASGDPVVEYSLLGSTVEEGIFAWVAFGVDLSVSKNVSAAAILTESGGVANPNSGMRGGPGGPPPTK